MAPLIKLRNKVMDIFFVNPYVFDVIFSLFIVGVVYFLDKNGIISICGIEDINKIISSVGVSCITLTGFVLTILTIVVTFKNTEDSKKQKNIISDTDIADNQTKIELFFNSDLYYKTVRILQQSVSGLVFIFVLFVFMELFFKSLPKNLIVYTTIGGVIFTILIISRCIITLKLIINLQISNKEENE